MGVNQLPTIIALALPPLAGRMRIARVLVLLAQMLLEAGETTIRRLVGALRVVRAAIWRLGDAAVVDECVDMKAGR